MREKVFRSPCVLKFLGLLPALPGVFRFSAMTYAPLLEIGELLNLASFHSFLWRPGKLMRFNKAKM